MKKAITVEDPSPSVLVIDEDPAILAVLSGILSNNGFRALLARSADEAVGIAARVYVPIDLVLTDVQIPGGTGTEVLARIREARPDVRALYMSASVEAEVIRIKLLADDSDPAADDLLHLGLVPGLIDDIRKHCNRPPAQRTRGASSR